MSVGFVSILLCSSVIQSICGDSWILIFFFINFLGDFFIYLLVFGYDFLNTVLYIFCSDFASLSV